METKSRQKHITKHVNQQMIDFLLCTYHLFTSVTFPTFAVLQTCTDSFIPTSSVSFPTFSVLQTYTDSLIPTLLSLHQRRSFFEVLAMASSTKNPKSKNPNPSTSSTTYTKSKNPNPSITSIVTKPYLIAYKIKKDHELVTTKRCDGKQLQRSICGSKRGLEEMIDKRSGKRLKQQSARKVVEEENLVGKTALMLSVKGLKQEPARKVGAKSQPETVEEEETRVSKIASMLSGSSADNGLSGCLSMWSLPRKTTMATESMNAKGSTLATKKLISVKGLKQESAREVVGVKVEEENQVGKSKLSGAFGAKSSATVVHRRSTQSTKRMEPIKKEASIGKKVPLGIARTSDLKVSSRTSGGVSPAFHSDDMALRVEMLKKRFADTILKAQKQKLLSAGEERDQLKMEEMKKKMEEENKRFERQEAEGKASRDGHGSDSKMQRQRQREAARIALEKMEKSVEFEDNISVLREFAHMMGDFSFAGPLGGYSGMYVPAKQFVNGKLKNPLECFGLYLKEDDDYMFGDDHGNGRETLPEDYEEGELLF